MKQTSRLPAVRAVSLAVVGVMFGCPAFAADPTPPAVAEATLPDIIVTAQKRQQNLQEVSASITALGETALEEGGIVDVTRLGALVPGVQVGLSGGEARIAMRGARQNEWGPEGATVVGVFNDGAFVPTTTQIMASYLDVNRIEVLRGPQGTLYGRNTFAGAINIISNQPDFKSFGGSIEGTGGAYNERRLTSVLNLPINETLAVRIAAMTDAHDGYVRNTYYANNANDLNNQNVQAGRISVRWKPTDDFDATLRLTTTGQDVNGSAIWGYEQIACYRNNQVPANPTGLGPTGTFVSGNCDQPGPNTPIQTGTTGRAATQQDGGPWSVSRDSPSRDKNSSRSYNLQTSYEMGWSTLKFIGDYEKYSSLQYYDTDYSNGYFAGTDSRNNYFAGYDNSQTDSSAELQLVSPDKGPVRWVAGAYYFHQNSDWSYGYLNNGSYARYGSTIDPFISTSHAAFGNVTYSLSNDLRLVGGLRYNQDSTKNQGNAATAKSNKTLWKAGVEYNAADHILVYGTTSTGYREGGTNGTSLVAAGAPATFGPETIMAYELGVKTESADRRMIFDAAIYDNEFKDMQAQSFVTTCTVPGVLSSCIANQYISNGGAVSSKGLELEFKWRPVETWFVDANAALMHARFGNYVIGQLSGLGNWQGRQDVTQTQAQLQASGANPGLQLRGWTPAMTPSFTATAQVGHEIRLWGDNTLTPMIQESYVGNYWSYDVNVPGVEQSAYTKTDVRLTWRNAKKGLEVEAFVQNLENKAVLTRSVVFNDSNADPNVPTTSIQAAYGDPRIWGLRVRLDF